MQFCFSIRDWVTNAKIIGGTMTAESMDDAARRVVQRCKITPTRKDYPARGGEYPYQPPSEFWFMMRGKRVLLQISAHPEYLFKPHEFVVQALPVENLAEV